MYVCMNVCRYVRMYVCTYVCMYVCMCASVYVFMCVCLTFVSVYLCMCVCVYVCMFDICICVSVYVCMCVCICVCICIYVYVHVMYTLCKPQNNGNPHWLFWVLYSIFMQTHIWYYLVRYTLITPVYIQPCDGCSILFPVKMRNPQCSAQTEGCKIYWHSFLASKSLVVHVCAAICCAVWPFWSCGIEVLDYNKWRGFGHISLDQKARNHRSRQVSYCSIFFEDCHVVFFNPKQSLLQQQVVFISAHLSLAW